MFRAEAHEYLDRIPPDEPVFILRAKDVYAPSTVVVWAGLVSNSKCEGDEARARCHNKAQRALKDAEEMRDWQEQNTSKVPD